MTYADLPRTAPAVGQLVHLRARIWLVDEVIAPAVPGQTCRVRLSCADDDAQGQALEVLWDYELDRQILNEEGWADLAAPLSVLEQWQAELEERFGLVFELLDRAYLTRMRRERGFGVNPWRTHSRFLVSHHLLGDPTYADPLRESQRS